MICTPFILVFGLITAPLSLIFGWRGFYTLYIANQESCSFLKAKEILAKGDKYKIVSNSLLIYGSPLIVVHRHGDRITNSDIGQQYSSYSLRSDLQENSDFDYYRYSPSYSHLPSNIYYSSNYDSYSDDRYRYLRNNYLDNYIAILIYAVNTTKSKNLSHSYNFVFTSSLRSPQDASLPCISLT